MKKYKFNVYSGDKYRATFTSFENAASYVESLEDADKYVNCCYEPGYHYVKVVESED